MARLPIALVLALGLITPAARAGEVSEDRPHFALAVGSGVAFGCNGGIQAQLLYGHFCGTSSQNTYSCQRMEWRPDLSLAVGFDF
jgi:hypothetical protein